MSEIEVGARVRAPVYVSRDILEVRGLTKVGNEAAVEDSSGNLFTVFTKTLTLVPDILTVEIPRALAQKLSDGWGNSRNDDFRNFAADCKRALVEQ